MICSVEIKDKQIKFLEKLSNWGVGGTLGSDVTLSSYGPLSMFDAGLCMYNVGAGLAP